MKSMKTRAAQDGELPIDRVPMKARQMLRAARSLRPGPAMMDACSCGDPEAIAIRDAWKFCFPVRKVNAEEFEAICERGQVTFHG